MNRSAKFPPVLPPEVMQALLESQAETQPDPDTSLRLKNRILGRVRDEAWAESRVAAILTVRAEEGEWISLGPKVEMKTLLKVGEVTHFMLRLAPGALLPPHDHLLDEESFCLEGEVQYGDVVLGAGDFHLAPRGTPHGLIRSRKGALLYLRGADPRDFNPRDSDPRDPRPDA